ncbi:MAG: hypothetical protein ACR2NF_02600 [Pirellulales bacterium]
MTSLTSLIWVAVFGVTDVPSDLFSFVVIGTGIFASISILRMVFDPNLPSQTQGGRILIGLLALAWIGFFTMASFQGGAFVGLLNIAPYFLLKAVHHS